MGPRHPSKEQASSRTNKDVKHHIPGQKNNIWVREKKDGIEQVRRSESGEGTSVSLETIRKENTQRKTGETLESRTRRLLERYHLAEDSAK